MTGVWQPRPPADDEPACWSWPVPPVRDLEAEIALIAARSRAEAAAGDPGSWVDAETLRMAYYAPGVIRWQEFHSGVRLADERDAPERCAVCGVAERWPQGRLVDDHCHATGQVRGRLCRRCNTREGHGGGRVFDLYRRVHPAAILDAHEMYSGFAWTAGWSWREHGDRSRSGVSRPPTPWPPVP